MISIKTTFNALKFHGVFPAFYACYDDFGNISKIKTQNLVKWLCDKGINGLYLTGSSGEAFMQTTDERKTIVESVMEVVKDDCTVIVHVGATSTKESIDLSKHAEKLGVNAISAVPSVYYQIPDSCIEKHWDSIIDSVDLPFIIYNIPQTTGYSISADLFKRMAKKDRVVGIKNSSVSSSQINYFRRNSPEGFIVFNGPDDQFLAGRMLGANGGIGGTYCCMPEFFVNLNEAIENQDMTNAMLWQNRINIIIDKLRSFPETTTIAVAKAVLNARGIDVGGIRLPIVSIPQDNPEIIHIASQIEEFAEL